MSPESLPDQMLDAAREVESSAGKLDRRGEYARACDSLRLANLLREAAAQLREWEAAH